MKMNKIDFTCKIESLTTGSSSYTEKLIDHHLGKQKLSLKDYLGEICNMEFNPLQKVKKIEFELSAIINGITIVGKFIIDPYVAYFCINYGLFHLIDQIKVKNLNYILYEHLYQEPTYRLRLLSEIGPKLFLEEFQKRMEYLKEK